MFTNFYDYKIQLLEEMLQEIFYNASVSKRTTLTQNYNV